jgi:4-amino-4-deoxy-L-arabinose transferase-like glycosyltransferase
VAAALGIGLAAHASARLLAPARPNVAVYAAAVALFLPMYMGPAVRIGNEVLASALSATSVWLLLRCLQRPDALHRAVLLGAVLGLAVLTKFSALVVLATSGIVLLLRGWRDHGLRLAALRSAAAVGIVALLCSGWYFARNLHHYGQPIVMQTELVSNVMKKQGYGPPRPLGDYFSLDPGVLLNPARNPRRMFGAVWPATFAMIWYDVHGQALKVGSRWGLRFAWILFACGAVISAAALVGVTAALRRRRDLAPPLAVPTLLLLGFLTLSSYVGFTPSRRSRAPTCPPAWFPSRSSPRSGSTG